MAKSYELCFEKNHQYFKIDIEKIKDIDYTSLKSIDEFTKDYADQHHLKKILMEKGLLSDFNFNNNLCIVENNKSIRKKIFNGNILIFENNYYKCSPVYFKNIFDKFMDNHLFIKKFIEFTEKKYKVIPSCVKRMGEAIFEYETYGTVSIHTFDEYRKGVIEFLEKELNENKDLNYNNLHNLVTTDIYINEQIEKEAKRELYYKSKPFGHVIEQDIINNSDEEDYTTFDEQLNNLLNLYNIKKIEDVNKLSKTAALEFLNEYNNISSTYKQKHKM